MSLSEARLEEAWEIRLGEMRRAIEFRIQHVVNGNQFAQRLGKKNRRRSGRPRAIAAADSASSTDMEVELIDDGERQRLAEIRRRRGIVA